ncbi:RNA polymerase III RPC4-domain-containing protein [Phlyctochytrium arcticum]|nr:RNA polymerase III RPC4-domain-containing protein [Phlyctochytrium arcticum]
MSGQRSPARAAKTEKTKEDKNGDGAAASGIPPEGAPEMSARRSQRQPGTLEAASTLSTVRAGRLGSLKAPRDMSAPVGESSASAIKPKFAPTVPARRNKKDVTTEAVRPELKPRAPRERRARPRPEDNLTASGPFAFGPAQRGLVATPSRYSGSDSRKTEVVTAERQREQEEIEDDGAFDPDDSWAPVSMGGPRQVKKDRLKREKKRAHERAVRERETRSKEAIRVKLEGEIDGVVADLAESRIDKDSAAIPLLDDLAIEEEEFVDDDKPQLGPPVELIQPKANEFLFFQFPSILPTFVPPITTIDDDAMDLSAPAPPTTTAPRPRIKSEPKAKTEAGLDEAVKEPVGPDGQVGRMLIYKSGKIKLDIGGILFDVTPSPEASYVQSVVAVQGDIAPSCYMLGDVSKRFVCSPDIESLLASNDPL